MHTGYWKKKKRKITVQETENENETKQKKKHTLAILRMITFPISKEYTEKWNSMKFDLRKKQNKEKNRKHLVEHKLFF